MSSDLPPFGEDAETITKPGYVVEDNFDSTSVRFRYLKRSSAILDLDIRTYSTYFFDKDQCLSDRVEVKKSASTKEISEALAQLRKKSSQKGPINWWIHWKLDSNDLWMDSLINELEIAISIKSGQHLQQAQSRALLVLPSAPWLVSPSRSWASITALSSYQLFRAVRYFVQRHHRSRQSGFSTVAAAWNFLPSLASNQANLEWSNSFKFCQLVCSCLTFFPLFKRVLC